MTVSPERPAVSVVVPFSGRLEAARALLRALRRLEIAPGDELIVADNTRAAVVPDDDWARVVRAPELASAYHARNAGAGVASAPWLLFTDADCEPPADLLERMLVPAPADDCAIVAGEVAGDRDQVAPAARWARSRRGLYASHHVELGPRPAGVTANLLVRRAAFEAAGGFNGGVRSDADVDLCWRLQDLGWHLEYRPRALVSHRDPERLSAMLGQARGYGAGRRWLRREWGEGVPVPRLGSPLVRALGGSLRWALGGDLERARFKLLDGASAAAIWWGHRVGDNRAPAPADRR